MTELTIRPAQASDLEAAVPLIYSSGPEAFDYIFNQAGISSREFLQRAFVTGRGLFGFNNHWVAECKGEVVGAVALYSAAEYNRYSLDVLLQVLRFYPPGAWMPVLGRSLKTKRWMPPPPRCMDYVANFGVAESVRGQGAGRKMLDYGLARARERGKTVYALDVADTNPRAQALYERFGMQLVSEQASPAPGRVPGARRLSMAIEAA